MTKTESFEELDNLTEDMKDLHLHPTDLKKTPQFTKWKTAFTDLDSKKRDKYMKKEEFEERLKNNDIGNNHRIWNTREILSDTDALVFFLPNRQHKNEERYKEEKNMFQKVISKSEDLDMSAKLQWMDNPEIVNIDLAKVHNLSHVPQTYFKTGRELGSFYKDGILLRYNNKKNNSFFHIKFGYNDEDTHMKEYENFYQTTPCFEVVEVTNNNQSLFADMTYDYYDFKDWKKECFNSYNFPIYIMFENFSKIKAVKINLKNNKKINAIKNGFRKNNKCHEKNIFEYEYPRGIPFEISKKMGDARSHGISSFGPGRTSIPNNHLSVKKGFLRSSWTIAIENHIGNIFKSLQQFITKLSNEEVLTVKKIHVRKIRKAYTAGRFDETDNYEKLKHFVTDYYDFIISYKGSKSRYQTTKEFMSILEKHKQLDVTSPQTIELFMLDSVKPILERFFRTKNMTSDMRLKNKKEEKDVEKLIERIDELPLVLNYIFLLLVLVYKTRHGTHLPNHKPIIFEDFSDSDCAVYWTHSAQILTLGYFKGVSIEKKPPLVLDEKGIVNIQKLTIDRHAEIRQNRRTVLPSSNSVYKSEEIEKIMEEAFNNEIYQVPWGASAPVDDEIFTYLQFFEFDNYFLMFAFDKRNRYFFEVYDKEQRRFVGYFFNKAQNHVSKIDETAKLIYVKFAEVIRDFKILIDRDITMKYHGRRLPPIEGNFDGPLEIWLPRKRYRYKKKTVKRGSGRIYHTKGFRIQHIRRLRIGTEASERALRAAKRANVTVDEGYTYVRGAQWNKSKMSKREIIYRHKSLSGPFYVSNDEIKKVKTIDEMSGAAFEEHCKKYIQDKDLDVDRERNTDDGIDIIAYETTKGGEEVKVTIQCKNNRKKPVGPDIVRALCGSPDYKDSKEKVRGMIIASGGFTRGARDYAEQNNIELVSDDLLK